MLLESQSSYFVDSYMLYASFDFDIFPAAFRADLGYTIQNIVFDILIIRTIVVYPVSVVI